MRDAAEQVCPAFWMPALTRKGSAASRSASAKTICGLLPPSSSVTGTVFFAAAAWISRPTATEPVKDRCCTPRMRRQRRAGFLAQPRHHVQRAGRQAGLVRDAREGQRRQAGLLGRLQHAGVAHRQRGADAAADDLHRVVPRHDVAGDAMRLAQRQRGVAGGEGDRLAHHLVGRAAVELEVARQRQRVGAALAAAACRHPAPRAAPVRRPAPSTRGRHAHQHAAALGGRQPAPGARRARPAPRPRRRRCRRPRRARSAPAALPSDGLNSGSVSPLAHVAPDGRR